MRNETRRPGVQIPGEVFEEMNVMRKIAIAILALSAAGVATLASSGPASAYDYPWCVQGRGVGIPGDCSYQTYAQCQASASGRFATCNINPRVAFRRPYRGQPAYGYPPRYGYGYGPGYYE
jgi:Protein of unknown function (DUF3551)